MVTIGKSSYSIDSLLIVVDSIFLLNESEELLVSKQILDTMHFGDGFHINYMNNHYNDNLQFQIKKSDDEIFIQSLIKIYKIDSDSCLKSIRSEFLMTPTKLKSVYLKGLEH